MSTHLRWYRIVAEQKLSELPFANFYREQAQGSHVEDKV